MFLVILS